MKKYDNYKTTDIKLMPSIPEHWGVNQLKRVCSVIKDGTHGSFKRVESGYRLLSVRNIVDSKFVFLDDDSYISKEDFISIYRSLKIRENDIQLAIVGATMGKVALVPQLPIFVTQRSLATIRTISKILNSEYLFYFIQSTGFQSFLWANTSFSAQPGIYLGAIQRIDVPIPPINEQLSIANYLRQKTLALAQKISLLETKVLYYQALSRSLINETVCKGLNKDVLLKDSGIEWIGEIPKHWQVKRLKDVGYLYSGLSGKTGEHFNQEVSDNSQHYIPFTNIANNKYINHEDLHTVLMDENERQNKVKKNDLFFLMSSEGFADIGKSALLIEDVKDTYLNSFCKGYRITKKTVVPKYLNYLLNSPAFRDKFIVQGKGFTRINLKMEKVSDFEFIIPPVEEQTAIAEHLDKKTTTIDAIVANIKLQIDSLKELRKTLINDVVTGKLKVTE